MTNVGAAGEAGAPESSDYDAEIAALERALFDMQTQTWLCDARVKAKFLHERGVRAGASGGQESRELIPVQYLAGLMEGAIWAERPDETSYCPRPELVEQWAAEIAPHIQSYVETALRSRAGEERPSGPLADALQEIRAILLHRRPVGHDVTGPIYEIATNALASRGRCWDGRDGEQ